MMALSPLNKRRWQRFKSHRRGYWSLWVFLACFVLSLGAEFIANDKPLAVQYNDEWYFPVFQVIPETTFGGFLPGETKYSDPFVLEEIEANGKVIWAPIPHGYQDPATDLGDSQAPTPPDAKHWLGTDDEGRDVVARVIYGFRISVLFGLILTVVSSVVGIAVGMSQGYWGGWVDLLGQRILEIWSALPVLYLLIILSAIVKPNFWWLLGLMCLFSWVALVGLVRAEVLRARNLEYVKAARALGQSDGVIMRKHILPNAMVATITFLPFILSGAVVTLSSLDFIGFGLPPGSASLGELLKQGKENIQAPWLGITGFCSLAVMLGLLVFIGEAVRDAFDPRKDMT